MARTSGHDAGSLTMHDIKWIRENPAAFDAGLKRRGLEPMSGILLAIDEARRAAILKSEQAQARRNAASKEIGEAKKARDDARAAKLMAEVAELKTTMPELELAAKSADDELATSLAAIPNLPANDVPEGLDEHGNVQHHVFGDKRRYGFTPKAHDELGEALGFMDFETAAKLSGARFVVLKKGLARLERAVRGAQERFGPAGARDRTIHARSAHQRAWIHGRESTVDGAQPCDVRHRAIAEV